MVCGIYRAKIVYHAMCSTYFQYYFSLCLHSSISAFVVCNKEMSINSTYRNEHKIIYRT